VNNLTSVAWWKAASVRAIKTAAQVVLGMITVGMTVQEIDWKNVISVAVVAALYSYVTSLAGIPEVDNETMDGRD
jgi:hypothetical protein